MASQWEHIKWVPGTPFMVDGFAFQSSKCAHYFLTHYHSDHTIGLRSNFSSGMIYCSQITSNLLIKDMRINPACIRALPLDKEQVIEGIPVTLIDANHCPGAVLLLFKTPPPKGSVFSHENILHTGDMRWHPRMGKHPALAKQRVDQLFLDTTYASPKHTFPSQERAICKIVELMSKHAAQEPRTLFVMGSYRIGKERAYLGAAKALGYRCHVNADKLRVLRLLGLPEADYKVITKDKNAARIHVSFMGKIFLPEALRERIADTKWTQVVAFRPTGWSFQKKGLNVRKDGNVTIYGIPYSEHSSYDELRDCVRTLRPRKLIPTVNAANSAAAKALVDRFADLMDLSKDRSRLDFFLLRKAKTTPADGLDCAAPGSPSAGAMPRADTAPAAGAAVGAGMCLGDTGGGPMSGGSAALEDATADEAGAAHEEALYWQQHGEVEEDEHMCQENQEHSHAAGCGSLEDTWLSPALEQGGSGGEALPATCPAGQPVAAAWSMAPVNTLPEPSPSSFMSRDCTEEMDVSVLCTARIKREPLELFKSSAACGLEQGQNILPSLQHFSYSKGQPSAGENSGTRQGSCASRDRKVLVELGLDSPKARLPACMAAGSAAAAPPKLGSPAAGGQPYKVKEEASWLHHEQMQEQPGSSPPDSWATASERSQHCQHSQGQHLPRQHDCSSPPCTPKQRGSACHGCQAAHVIDICSPEKAAPKQAAPATRCIDSAHAVKGEPDPSMVSRDEGHVRSPTDREPVDLAAVDLAEQKRILRMISMHKSLKEDLQASRLCMQALSSGAQPDQGLKRRDRAAAAAETARAPQPTGSIKRRQLGIGAFLLSQQRTNGA